MQPGRGSGGSAAGRQGQRNRRAYTNAMNSKTASLLGITPTRPTLSQPAEAASSDPAAEASSPQMAIDSDVEEYSFDKNDTMSEEDAFVDGSIEISDDGNSVDTDGGASLRGKKRQKGMKVGPKVIVQSKKSTVWDHFEEVPVPSTTETGVMVLMARCNYCKKFFSYRKESGGATSHLIRHYKQSCKDYKIALAKVASQTLLNFQPSSANDTGIPIVHSSREYSQEEAKKLIAKMVICHDYPFRMVEHTWFNIVMKYLNPRYEFIGRKTIRKECMKMFESERESLMKTLKGVD